MSDIPELDTLFAYRFIFDDPKDLVNLDQDVKDLQGFPERLDGSYKQEWWTYVKRATARQKLDLNEFDLEEALSNLSSDDQERFNELLSHIERAESINSNDKVKVIKSPLKAYIESLIKL